MPKSTPETMLFEARYQEPQRNKISKASEVD